MFLWIFLQSLYKAFKYPEATRATFQIENPAFHSQVWRFFICITCRYLHVIIGQEGGKKLLLPQEKWKRSLSSLIYNFRCWNFKLQSNMVKKTFKGQRSIDINIFLLLYFLSLLVFLVPSPFPPLFHPPFHPLFLHSFHPSLLPSFFLSFLPSFHSSVSFLFSFLAILSFFSFILLFLLPSFPLFLPASLLPTLLLAHLQQSLFNYWYWLIDHVTEQPTNWPIDSQTDLLIDLLDDWLISDSSICSFVSLFIRSIIQSNIHSFICSLIHFRVWLSSVQEMIQMLKPTLDVFCTR